MILYAWYLINILTIHIVNSPSQYIGQIFAIKFHITPLKGAHENKILLGLPRSLEEEEEEEVEEEEVEEEEEEGRTVKIQERKHHVQFLVYRK